MDETRIDDAMFSGKTGHPKAIHRRPAPFKTAPTAPPTQFFAA